MDSHAIVWHFHHFQDGFEDFELVVIKHFALDTCNSETDQSTSDQMDEKTCGTNISKVEVVLAAGSRDLRCHN